jgi:hypothetical protein
MGKQTETMWVKRPFLPTLTPLETAIWRTVAYADLFDYPLTAVQIHRYLEGVAATLPDVQECLESSTLYGSHIIKTDHFFTLPNRSYLISKRLRREKVAATRWPAAVQYGRLIAHLPFVKMVALTGSLTMNNVEADADIDYLIVTENGRLWLCRAFIIAVVRLASRQNIILCPNYILTERATQFPDKNLYTAHEVAQMVPLAGEMGYGRLRQQNMWANTHLPNAKGSPMPHLLHSTTSSWLQKLLELPFRTPIGTWLEKWEMQRKIGKFQAKQQKYSETSFCPDWCKGHFGGHQRNTLTAFQAQVSREA